MNSNASNGTWSTNRKERDLAYRKRDLVFEDMVEQGLKLADCYEALSADDQRSDTLSDESDDLVETMDMRLKDFEGELVENEADLVNDGHYVTNSINSKYEREEVIRMLGAFNQLRMKVPLEKFDKAVEWLHPRA
jgi:hypothetical protein